MSADRTAEFVALERRVIDLELALRVVIGANNAAIDAMWDADDLTPAERAAVTLVNSRGRQQRHRDLDRQEGTAHA